MKILNTSGKIENIELFGQLSKTGKAFDCGYYLALHNETVFFAEGEEKERDKFLSKNNVFDNDTPNWEKLCEENQDSFYYSEWSVADDLDGGFSEDGKYYLYDDKRKVFIKENRKPTSSDKPMCENCLSTKIIKIKENSFCEDCQEITHTIFNTL
jgi:hypothetical protein